MKHVSDFEKDDIDKYPPNEDIYNYVIFLYGKDEIVKRFTKVIIDGVYYIFLGVFKDSKKVPKVNCVFINGDGETVVKTVSRASIPKSETKIVERVARPMESINPSDDESMNIEIRPEDNELMVNMKSLLIAKNITIGQFKALYDDNKSDMNNHRALIERKPTLSWDKFTFLLNKLGHRYDLYIYDKNE